MHQRTMSTMTASRPMGWTVPQPGHGHHGALATVSVLVVQYLTGNEPTASGNRRSEAGCARGWPDPIGGRPAPLREGLLGSRSDTCGHSRLVHERYYREMRRS